MYVEYAHMILFVRILQFFNEKGKKITHICIKKGLTVFIYKFIACNSIVTECVHYTPQLNVATRKMHLLGVNRNGPKLDQTAEILSMFSVGSKFRNQLLTSALNRFCLFTLPGVAVRNSSDTSLSSSISGLASLRSILVSKISILSVNKRPIRYVFCVGTRANYPVQCRHSHHPKMLIKIFLKKKKRGLLASTPSCTSEC